jgi:hypothetical protein
MSRLRKVLAERAVASMVSSAQLTTVVEVDVTRIAEMRKSIQARFTAATGTKLNFMPFFFLASSEALRSHPKLNASIEGETINYHPSENISFAVDTDRGLPLYWAERKPVDFWEDNLWSLDAAVVVAAAPLVVVEVGVGWRDRTWLWGHT